MWFVLYIQTQMVAIFQWKLARATIRVLFTLSSETRISWMKNNNEKNMGGYVQSRRAAIDTINMFGWHENFQELELFKK